MNRRLRSLLTVMLVLSGLTSWAQNGWITGKVTDGKEGLVNASVSVSSGGIPRGGTITDYEGNYEVRNLPAGRYEVMFSYQGRRINYTDVIVSPNTGTPLNGVLENKTELKGAVVVAVRYTKPLVNIQNPGSTHTLTAAEIEKLPTLNTADAASLGTGVYQSRNGAGVSIAGGRFSGTKYIIDGVQLNPGDASFSNLPPGSIDQIQTMTSGLPARYGDASGGVITITTRGVTPTTRGSVWLEHSVDGYNNNNVSVNLSGPLLRKKDSAGNKTPVLGYAIGLSGTYNEDANPGYYDNYYLRDEVLNNLQEHPFVVDPNVPGGLASAAEYVTADDFVREKARRNAEQGIGRFTGKLDYALGDNINITFGASHQYANSNAYSRGRSIFDPTGQARGISNTSRGYLRFTQRFGKGAAASTGDQPARGIANASYTVQADYSREDNTTQDKDLKDNPFLYGYVGKFNQRFEPQYVFGQDTNTGVFGVRYIQNVVSGVDFTPADYNPLLTKYVEEYFRLTTFQPLALQQIIGARSTLINGASIAAPYGLFSGVGAGNGGYSKGLTEQIGITADANFQILGKIKQSFEVGIYYQQRTERYYNVNGRGLWQLMRNLTGRVNSNGIDLNSPTFVVDGRYYTEQDVLNGVVSISPSDTILYLPQVNLENQGRFDKSVREMLGLSVYDYVQVDMLDPTKLSLDMFSASELLNAGQDLVSYAGYDYTGKLVRGQVNFNDFFTQRDSRGDYTRAIGAFRPNYIAGYISDFIEFKDFKITLGVRAERFDLNTKVLKDPYSLYATRMADASTAANNPNGAHPGNITSDYVPYVGSNNSNNPTIVGYRNGDTWYDANGKEVDDPSTLGVGSSGSSSVIEPYLQNRIRIDSSAFDPNSSFTDYKPQVSLMPRINFSFPISENGFLYAHYNVVVQRPVTGYTATPADYYFFQSRALGGVIGNANLKPEKLIDYEVGFQQKVSNRSALTLSAFYRERKDQIAIRPYYNAYPIQYSTFGNRDFSTTKGFSALYDLRRSGPLSLELAYTLQFVEGTGSSEATRGGLLSNFTSAGLLNLRPVFALDYDSRHIINARATYRYLDNEGPKIGGKSVFQNAGVTLIGRVRSGEPYTKYANPTSLISSSSTRIEGTPNGARLPWHYGIDLRIDKDFVIRFKKPAAGAASMRDRQRNGGLFFNVYVRMENVLNHRDVLTVNTYTGNPLDDGFLASPEGGTATSVQTNAQSFVDLYRIALMNNGYFGGPRRTTIGLQINF